MGLRGVALALAFVAVTQVASARAAVAAPPDHVFNQTLSLTGGTGVSKEVDEVPDPGPSHPPKTFRETCGTAVDSHGDIYVASFGNNASEGRIDIFNPEGKFILEIGNEDGPCDLAVDASGALYAVSQNEGTRQLVFELERYTPSEYPPTPTTVYAGPVVVDALHGGAHGIAMNPANDHVFVSHSNHINEYGAASEGNPLLKSTLGQGVIESAKGVAFDPTSGDLLVGATSTTSTGIPTPAEPFVSRIYLFDPSVGPNGELKGTIDGHDIPKQGGFLSDSGKLYPAVDEASGEVFVDDIEGSSHVYRFVPSGGGEYEYAVDPELESHFYLTNAESRIAVANAADNPNTRNVYVTSSQTISHLFVFTPGTEVCKPEILGTSFSGVATSEAVLEATVNPCAATTEYRFQYVAAATYERDVDELGEGHGFDHAESAGSGLLPSGSQPMSASVALSGLVAGAEYHFRVVASNHCKPAEPEVGCEVAGEGDRFATYPNEPMQAPCPNEALRIGPSAHLPDCRAYELVSPAETGGWPVTAFPLGLSLGAFATQLASPDGESVIFETNGGSIPGTEGNGFIERYAATRSLSSGWSTVLVGPTGSQMEVPTPGGESSDHGYSFWLTGGGKGTPDHGSLVLGVETEYLRLPNGSFRLLGEGALGTEAEANGRWIGPGGTHVVFTSQTKLEEGAPPPGIEGVYDLTPTGLKVASLLPGDEPVPAGSSVTYQGASADGSAIAFRVTQAGVATLYVRLDDAETVAVESGVTTFAGLSADGSHLTYVKGGDIFSFETTAHSTTAVGSGGESTVVNVSADGSHVYFVSPKVLGESGGAVEGSENLYVWSEGGGEPRFIATITHADVIGEEIPGAAQVGGLGLWTSAAVSPLQGGGEDLGPANDPSRTSPDGRFILFESRADMREFETGSVRYETGGPREIYRYDSGDGSLLCISCNPDLAPASADSQLQATHYGALVPTNALSSIQNTTDDGRVVFFQTSESLVPADANGVQDVYEWETAGTGGCARAQGCLSLVSRGLLREASYLYGVAAGGRDAFIVSSDPLVPGSGAGGTPAVYDARIGGGFPVVSREPGCQLDSCQQGSSAPPPASEPGSAAITGPGNVRPHHTKGSCPNARAAGKQNGKKKNKGKSRCPSGHHHPKHGKGGAK